MNSIIDQVDSDKEADFVLFKFRAINKNLIDSLVKSYLYFTHPNKLNDPFDCQVDIYEALHKAIKQSNGKGQSFLNQLLETDHLEKIKDMTSNCGVFSSSGGNKPLENHLMWSHYANNHKGICLTYTLPMQWLHTQSKNIAVISQVEYGINLLSNWFNEKANEYPNTQPSQKEFAFEWSLIIRLLTIKNECWRYEDEIRIIRQQEGCWEINKSFLTQICFGLNVQQSDIALIKSICDKFGYATSFCQVKKTTDDFGLEIVELN